MVTTDGFSQVDVWVSDSQRGEMLRVPHVIPDGSGGYTFAGVTWEPPVLRHFTATLQKFLADHQPDFAACCFDAGSQTFRNEMFPAYKANRGAPPEDLVPQFDLCRELVARMGFTTAICPGYEADDLLATGGTMEAACKLVGLCGAEIVGMTVLIELGFLNGRDKLGRYGQIHSVIRYD